MNHHRLLLLASLLLVSFSSALADTPAKIAEDYRKAAAAALTKLNVTLEQSTVPLIAALVKAGDTAGAEELQEQLKAKTEIDHDDDVARDVRRLVRRNGGA